MHIFFFQCVSSENFTSCLEDLCKALWRIMHSYWCILNWHANLEENQKNDKTGKMIVFLLFVEKLFIFSYFNFINIYIYVYILMIYMYVNTVLSYIYLW